MSAEETLARIRALLEDESYYEAKPHKAYDAVMRIRRVLDEPERPAERQECPDGGHCHHGCAAKACFRVRHAEPLSAAHFPDNQWPDEIRAEHGAD